MTASMASPPDGDGLHPDLYLWLAAVFAREQTSESLAFLRGPEGHAFLRKIAAAPVLRDSAERLLAVVAQQADLGELAFDLAVVFSRLFLGVGMRDTSVSPYESVYTGLQGRLYQQATVDMEELLRAHGLSAMGTSEPPDHIAVELEFVGRLTAEYLETSDAVIAARRCAMLNDHLLRWAPQFCERCIERDPSGFYSAAAAILRKLLQIESDRLSV